MSIMAVGMLKSDCLIEFNCSINILDENDSPPVLDIPKSVVSISEYHDLLNPIVHIKAYDADDPLTLNGKVEMTVSAGSGRGNDKMFKNK